MRTRTRTRIQTQTQTQTVIVFAIASLRALFEVQYTHMQRGGETEKGDTATERDRLF